MDLAYHRGYQHAGDFCWNCDQYQTPGLTIFLGPLIVLFLVYAYFAVCLQLIAKKTQTPGGWLAWIPIANLYLMTKIAGKSGWWVILLFIPIVNIIVGVVLWMRIAEARGKPSWWGIMMIVPVIGFFVPAYLAFSSSSGFASQSAPPSMPPVPPGPAGQ